MTANEKVAVVNALSEARPYTALVLCDNGDETADGADNAAGEAKEGSESEDGNGGNASEVTDFDMSALSANDTLTFDDGTKMSVKQIREQQAEVERLKAQIAGKQTQPAKRSEQPNGDQTGKGQANGGSVTAELVKIQIAREIKDGLDKYPLLDADEVFNAIKNSPEPVYFGKVESFMEKLHKKELERMEKKNERFIAFKKNASESSSAAENAHETNKGASTPKINKSGVDLRDPKTIEAAFAHLFDGGSKK